MGFFGLQLENFYLGGGRIDFWWGGNKNLVGESLLTVRGIFPGGENEITFVWWGWTRDSPQHPPQ